MENGQCLISDLYGRVGVIQFHPVFEELLHAFLIPDHPKKRGVNVKPSIVNRIKIKLDAETSR
ncbi:ATP-binding protein [Clostridioides difficile]|nr:ATP-binding protein [Clostridioides difficile]